jgi:DNA polymerase III alpha subunit
MVFLTLEDETGMVNIAVRPNLYREVGGVINEYGLLLLDGKLQKDGRAVSVLAQNVRPFPNITPDLFSNASRDYH